MFLCEFCEISKNIFFKEHLISERHFVDVLKFLLKHIQK